MKNLNIDFIGKRKLFVIISCCIMGVGLLCNIIFGVELDIQFKGGAIVTYTYNRDSNIEQEDAEQKIEEAIGQSVSVQTSEDRVTDLNRLVISLTESKSLSTENQEKITDTLSAAYPDQQVKFMELSSVDPVMGGQFLLKCLAALLISVLFLILYVGIRFRKIGGISAGVGGILALVHDCLVMYFVFVVFRFPLDDNFLAVLLTILGFSLNDTIIIYDRIRENRRLMGPKVSITEIVNKSVNQSFTRSINTSLCTFVAVLCICVVAAANGITSILSFAIPLAFGIISGSYSTIVLCPIWALWRERKEKLEKQKHLHFKAKKA